MSGRGSGFPFKGGERDQETQAHRALLEGVDQGWGKGREGEGSTSQMGNGGGVEDKILSPFSGICSLGTPRLAKCP